MSPWEVLIQCGVCRLPVDLSQVCRCLGIGLYSYSQGYRMIQTLGLAAYLRGSEGFLFQNGEVAVAFYNQSAPAGRRCFTIAHEIAHYALGHAGDSGVVRREPAARDDPAEREANRFAAGLLAPACVLRGLRVDGPLAIERLCGLSYEASGYCWERMKRLYSLDEQSMREGGRPYFFRSPLEWRLYRQFEPFIRERAITPRP